MRILNNGGLVDSDIPDLTEDGRRDAQYRSGDCPHCCGCGLVLVDATNLDALVQTVGATCVCVHGRWIRAWHARFDKAILSRLPDLVAVLGHRDRQWRLPDDDDLI